MWPCENQLELAVAWAGRLATGGQRTMERWRYGSAASVGFLCGVVLFLLHGWIWQAEHHISQEVMQLAETAILGALIGCAAAFFQRQAAKRANDRHDRIRQIQIAREGDRSF
jgi:hypothetical protein